MTKIDLLTMDMISTYIKSYILKREEYFEVEKKYPVRVWAPKYVKILRKVDKINE
ncbi:MAG: hypothetical protein M1381_10945 [Deltaproteobacteria bacterium]|nr:hypothetical protein [Deltaproteobacteria bacterium]